MNTFFIRYFDPPLFYWEKPKSKKFTKEFGMSKKCRSIRRKTKRHKKN